MIVALTRIHLTDDARVAMTELQWEAPVLGELQGLLAAEVVGTRDSLAVLTRWVDEASLRAHLDDDGLELNDGVVPAEWIASQEPTVILGEPIGGEAGAPAEEVAESLKEARDLAQQVLAINAELSLMSRENARQTRLLKEAREELEKAYWRLEKVSEVLPICASCHAVRDEQGDWSDLADFMLEHSDFLSHAYCEDCAAEMLQSHEGGEG